MPDREKVIKGLECCLGKGQKRGMCEDCPYDTGRMKCNLGDMHADALALLKAQEARHRLEVHNIGNVDIPECVTWEQFQAVMDGVVAALEHTDKGESWPYDEDGAVKWE